MIEVFSCSFRIIVEVWGLTAKWTSCVDNGFVSHLDSKVLFGTIMTTKVDTSQHGHHLAKLTKFIHGAILVVQLTLWCSGLHT